MNSVPKIAENLYWIIENNEVNIIMENRGIMNFLMQKLLHKPKTSIIHLDEIGSFIWQRIDGIKTTEEIATDLERKFGEKATPIRERLEKYFNILREYNFISLNKI